MDYNLFQQIVQDSNTSEELISQKYHLDYDDEAFLMLELNHTMLSVVGSLGDVLKHANQLEDYEAVAGTLKDSMVATAALANALSLDYEKLHYSAMALADMRCLADMQIEILLAAGALGDECVLPDGARELGIHGSHLITNALACIYKLTTLETLEQAMNQALDELAGRFDREDV